MEKSDVMQAAAEASKDVQSPHDPDEQYGAPFSCETAMPGNYFMHDDITTPIRDAAYSGDAETVGETIAEWASYELRAVDSVDHEGIHEILVHGTHEMIWERWGKGGVGEGLAAQAVGLLPEKAAEAVVEEQFDCTLAKADRKHGVDFVDPSGETHQVKSTSKEPDKSDKKDADHLWWVKDSGEVKKID